MNQKPQHKAYSKEFKEEAAGVNPNQIKGVIFHSDRGSQHTSKRLKDALAKLGIKQWVSGLNG